MVFRSCRRRRVTARRNNCDGAIFGEGSRILGRAAAILGFYAWNPTRNANSVRRPNFPGQIDVNWGRRRRRRCRRRRCRASALGDVVKGGEEVIPGRNRPGPRPGAPGIRRKTAQRCSDVPIRRRRDPIHVAIIRVCRVFPIWLAAFRSRRQGHFLVFEKA